MKTRIEQMMLRGFHEDRSPDVIIELKEEWIDNFRLYGSTHGSSYKYDTHVPVLFYGWGIKKGKSNREINITDIAPTISKILSIPPPPETTGKVLFELIK
jgi:arylsulfatase A-like enzyme